MERCKRTLAVLEGQLPPSIKVCYLAYPSLLFLFDLPKGVVSDLKDCKGSSLEAFKPYLINWNIVPRTKKFGGLGLGGCVKGNIALWGKLWRFPRE